jgi:hypothetical protein
MKNDQVAVALRHLYRRDGSAERLVQNAARLARATIVGLRDRIEARAAEKFSDVELEGKPMSLIGTNRTN